MNILKKTNYGFMRFIENFSSGQGRRNAKSKTYPRKKGSTDTPSLFCFL